MDRLIRQWKIARNAGDRAAELILVAQIARRFGLSVGQIYKLVAL